MDTSFTNPLRATSFLKSRSRKDRPAYNVVVLSSKQGCFMDDRLQDHRVSSPSAAPSVSHKRPAVQHQPAQTTSGRRHMGVATNDPDYLPPVHVSQQRHVPVQPAHPRSQNPNARHLHAERYIEMPTSRKSIFIRRERAQRRVHLILAIVAIIVVIAFLLWFVLLR